MTMRAPIPLLIALLFCLVPFVPPLVEGEIFTFRDHQDYFAPLREFTASELRAGRIPFWNPYNGSGERWFANPQSGVFYPPAWLFLVLPFEAGYVLFLALHIALLAASMYLLSRRIGSPPAAGLAALAVGLGGPTTSLLDVSNNLATFAWIPLALWSAVAAVPFGTAVCAASFSLALAFLGGEPFLAFAGAIAFGATAFVSRGRAAYRLVALVGVAVPLLTAVQLVPFLDLLAGSDRTRGLPPGEAFRHSLAPVDWLTAVITVAGRDALAPLPLSQQFIPSLYLGALIVAFAVLGLVTGSRHVPLRRAVFWLLAAFVFLAVIAAGSTLPLIERALLAFRADTIRFPARLAPLAVVPIALLAAAGFDRLANASRNERMVSIAVLTITFFSAANLYLAAEGSLATLRLIWSASSVVAVACLFVLVPAVAGHRLGAPLMLVIAGLDLLAAASPFLGSGKFIRQLPPYALAVGSDGKVFRTGNAERHAAGAADRLGTLPGYTNLPMRKFDLSTPAPVVSAGYLSVHDEARRLPRYDLFDTFSATYLIAPSRFREHRRFRFAARRGGIYLYRNVRALPMAQVWSTATPARDSASAIRLLLASGHDARKTLIVSPPPASAWSSASGSAGNASIVRMTSRETVVHARLSRAAFVLVNQLDARGWRVSIDGRETRKYLGNGLFRTALVPPGDHTIVWKYRSPYFVTSAATSAVSFTFLVAFGLFQSRKKVVATSFR